MSDDVRRFAGKVAIVTGAAGGIGAALAAELVAGGARVVAVDLGEIASPPAGAVALAGDVGDTGVIEETIALAESQFGPVDMYFANAGVMGSSGIGTEEEWELGLGVNFHAHVRAARLLVPGWVERGSGHFVPTASAAGLLTQVGSAIYSVSKHAAESFAEWLSVTYGDQGVGVTCLCPMGVDTPLVRTAEASSDPAERRAIRAVTASGAVLRADDVARQTLDAVAKGEFLVLPHPEVRAMWVNRAKDTDRWLSGMRRMQAGLGD
ncbi:SDR family oxidoreductase [Dietzia sp.]|uniref:SDR family oxidoreductase n=1 Tax=Dietzia sp. TaxID=1871616 RepID=UPI002FD9A680